MRKLIPVFVLLSLSAFGQKKEIQEMQRDLAYLQDQVRTMQKSQDEKLAAIQALVQQALETSQKTATGMALLERSVGEQLTNQVKQVNQPVAELGSRMDGVSDQMASVRESVKDLTDRVGKLQTQLDNIQAAIAIIQNPPPPATTPGTSTGTAPQAQSIPPGDQIYSQARADYSANNMDLAAQQFGDYLKFYPTGSLASNSQFYLGEIHRAKGQNEEALKAYDMVLEKYPDGQKRADAQYMKGKMLVALGRKTEAADEFKSVAANYRSSNPDIYAKAQDELKRLGMAPNRRK
jgi:TolA-binding protein